MAANLQIGITRAVRRMEQASIRGKADQDVGLARSAPAGVAALRGDGVVERGHAAPRLLELHPQDLEGRPVLAL